MKAAPYARLPTDVPGTPTRRSTACGVASPAPRSLPRSYSKPDVLSPSVRLTGSEADFEDGGDRMGSRDGAVHLANLLWPSGQSRWDPKERRGKCYHCGGVDQVRRNLCVTCRVTSFRVSTSDLAPPQDLLLQSRTGGLTKSSATTARQAALSPQTVNPFVAAGGYRYCQGNCSTIPRPVSEFTMGESKKCNSCMYRQQAASGKTPTKASQARAAAAAAAVTGGGLHRTQSHSRLVMPSTPPRPANNHHHHPYSSDSGSVDSSHSHDDYDILSSTHAQSHSSYGRNGDGNHTAHASVTVLSKESSGGGTPLMLRKASVCNGSTAAAGADGKRGGLRKTASFALKRGRSDNHDGSSCFVVAAPTATTTIANTHPALAPRPPMFISTRGSSAAAASAASSSPGVPPKPLASVSSTSMSTSFSTYAAYGPASAANATTTASSSLADDFACGRGYPFDLHVSTFGSDAVGGGGAGRRDSVVAPPLKRMSSMPSCDLRKAIDLFSVPETDEMNDLSFLNDSFNFNSSFGLDVPSNPNTAAATSSCGDAISTASTLTTGSSASSAATLSSSSSSAHNGYEPSQHDSDAENSLLPSLGRPITSLDLSFEFDTNPTTTTNVKCSPAAAAAASSSYGARAAPTSTLHSASAATATANNITRTQSAVTSSLSTYVGGMNKVVPGMEALRGMAPPALNTSTSAAAASNYNNNNNNNNATASGLFNNSYSLAFLSPMGRIKSPASSSPCLALDDAGGLMLSPLRGLDLDRVMDGLFAPDHGGAGGGSSGGLDTSFPLFPADSSFGLGL